ncbi:MAG: hypothetical protein A2284_08320 [Deltaproteobacteria bacterium RIFOXYA12_FULL_61_11]|nr:MAG: hypothetical protein A2284_08320 [Deltaproteobacteria bacterium RIFOXYA12_FULL_61_11]
MKKILGILIVLFLTGTAYATSVLPQEDCILVTKWSKAFKDQVGDDLLTFDEGKAAPQIGERVMIVSKKVVKNTLEKSWTMVKDTAATGLKFVIIWGAAVDMVLETIAQTVVIAIDQTMKIGDSMLILGMDMVEHTLQIMANFAKIAGLNIQIFALEIADQVATIAAKIVVATGIALAAAYGSVMAFVYKGMTDLSKFYKGMTEGFLQINIKVASFILGVNALFNKLLQDVIVFVGTKIKEGVDYLHVKEEMVAKKIIEAQLKAEENLKAKLAAKKAKLGLGAKAVFAKVPECGPNDECIAIPAW